MNNLEEKTKEELIELLKQKKSVADMYSKDSTKYRNKYENLKNIVKSIVLIIEEE